MDAALLATLGSEPQVVTLTYDLLRAGSYPVAKIVVIQTDGNSESSRSALKRLRAKIACTMSFYGMSTAQLAVTEPDWAYVQLGKQLNRSHKTVDTRLQVIYRKLEEAFGLDVGVNRGRMMKLLAPYWLNYQEGS